MMTGPAAAKDFVNNYLKLALPDKILEFRNNWNLAEEELPLPQEESYVTFAPPSLEYMTQKLPALYTVILTTRSMTRIGYTDIYDPVYQVVYAARTYLWVRTNGMNETSRMRDNLLTVVRTTLLDEQAFEGAAEKLYMDETTDEVKFDEGTLKEEFSDMIPQKGDRWAAGVYLSYDMTINEVVTRKTIGTVNQFEIGHYAFLEE